MNIAGIDRAVLLAELFNGTGVVGMGILQAHRGPDVMTPAYAETLLRAADKTGKPVHDNALAFPGTSHGQSKFYFDYLFGRIMKIEIPMFTDEIDTWGYDRDNPKGNTVESIVNKIRSAQ